MKKLYARRTGGLLASSALISTLVFGQAALAQNANPASTGASRPAELGEVVVTATRQSNTVNRVALSITAATQRTLDQEGVRRVDDLARTIPGLNIVRSGANGDPSINIRGISSPVGAPTAGFYLDDTPLTKRNAGNGILYGANGPPVPQIFDLDRVEVLRGPQGTLFGGSSEGGAVRYITPTPSLTAYSTYARGTVSSTEGGDPSYEAGVAIGGPIIPDKLGFRASVWNRHTGGYIDHVDMYTGKTIGNNTNSGEARSFRLSVLWNPTPDLSITPAVFYSYDMLRDQDQYWEKVPQNTTLGTTFTNSGTINGVKYAFPAKVFPSFTDGPYNMFGFFKSGTNYAFDTNGNAIPALSGRSTQFFTPSLTVDYVMPWATAHNSVAYLQDLNKAWANGRVSNSTVVSNAELTTGVTGNCGQTTGILNTSACQPIRLPGYPLLIQDVETPNKRYGITEEFRLSSPPGAGPFSWVAGLFYETTNNSVEQTVTGNTEPVAAFFHGIYEPYLTGVRLLNATTGQSGVTNSSLQESQTALFGEANYQVTTKLKVTVGVRVSRDTFHFAQTTGGQVTGAPAGFVGTTADPFPDNPAACPSSPAGATPATNLSGCPYTYTNVTTTATPVTPKIALSYQLTADDLFYASASKGYRDGGVNPPVSAIVCAVDFAALGITQTPQQFGPDSLWSYEAGAKLRLFNRTTQLNSSVFYVNWTGVQTNARLAGCGRTYTINGGSAISKGFDTQFQSRLGYGITLSGTFAYTDAYYNSTLLGVGGGTIKPQVLTKGEPLPNNPKYQFSVAVQKDFDVMGKLPAYVRLDYQYKSPFYTGVGPQDVGYTPFSYQQSQTHFMTARAAVTKDNLEISLFVNNLTNSRDRLSHSQEGGSALFVDTTYRPREIGLELTYRH